MIVEESSKPTIHVWHVVFMDREDLRWWDRIWTRPGFRHVLAYGYCADHDKWVLVNPAERITIINIFNDDQFDHWYTAMLPLTSMILQAEIKCEGPFHMKLGGWCTFAIKQLLGIKSGALTPHRLCKDLMQTGAIVEKDLRQ